MRYLTGGPGDVQYLLWKVDASHEGGLAAARATRRLHADRILIFTMKPFADVHRRYNELAPHFSKPIRLNDCAMSYSCMNYAKLATGFQCRQ